MRLFPKSMGARSYRLTGIAARCDWVLMTDGEGESFDAQLRGNLTLQPRTVFVSMRSAFDSLSYFCHKVLPKISCPFVLITGSEDFTLPNQIDYRWKPLTETERILLKNLQNDERLIHWFIENRDEDIPKTSPLPTGYVFEKEPQDIGTPYLKQFTLESRPLRVLCAHRVRSGRQWDTRRRVSQICVDHFSDFCSVITGECSFAAFINMVRTHSFVICAEGGGLDPSPKAWLSIMNGSIPIVRINAQSEAYSQLPVMFVDDWNEDCLSIDKLLKSRSEIAEFYRQPEAREEVLFKLSLDYWWRKITEKWEDYSSQRYRQCVITHT